MMMRKTLHDISYRMQGMLNTRRGALLEEYLLTGSPLTLDLVCCLGEEVGQLRGCALTSGNEYTHSMVYSSRVAKRDKHLIVKTMSPVTHFANKQLLESRCLVTCKPCIDDLVSSLRFHWDGELGEDRTSVVAGQFQHKSRTAMEVREKPDCLQEQL
jgi:hypothetical protein